MSSELLLPRNVGTKVRFYFLLAVAPPRGPVISPPVQLNSSTMSVANLGNGELKVTLYRKPTVIVSKNNIPRDATEPFFAYLVALHL